MPWYKLNVTGMKVKMSPLRTYNFRCQCSNEWKVPELEMLANIDPRRVCKNCGERGRIVSIKHK